MRSQKQCFLNSHIYYSCTKESSTIFLPYFDLWWTVISSSGGVSKVKLFHQENSIEYFEILISTGQGVGCGFVLIFKYILYCPQQIGAARKSNIFLYLAKAIKILRKTKPQKAYLK